MYDVDEVLSHYIVTALWSSYDESDENGGDPMDQKYTPDDVADKAREIMRGEISEFLAEIERDRPGVYAEMAAGTVWEDPGQVGHDFWLTRNGHGTGFWDRYYGPNPAAELGDYLTTCAHRYGEVDLYVGDDGKIYQQ